MINLIKKIVLLILKSTNFIRVFRGNEEKLNLCSKVFENAGGSWYSFFKGEVDQVKLLKRAVKVVVLKEQIDKKRS